MSDTINDDTPCVAGCRIYSGNERKHHKHCPHYPESFSRRFDELQAENKRLKEILKEYRTCELCKHGQRLEFLMDEEWKKYCQNCESGSPENNWEFDEQALIKALKGQTDE